MNTILDNMRDIQTRHVNKRAKIKVDNNNERMQMMMTHLQKTVMKKVKAEDNNAEIH